MPYWTAEEERELIDMVQQGKPIEEICKIFHRSTEAIRMKIRRLGLTPPAAHKVTFSATTTTLPEVKPAELISMKEMMEILAGALEQLRSRENLSPLEVRRHRLIVSTARTYMRMLERYEQWTNIEQRMVNMEARFLEHHKQQLARTEDPAEQDRLKERIKQLEEDLAQSSKYYKPFEKKPSLMAPR